jgi:hypothetical protein
MENFDFSSPDYLLRNLQLTYTDNETIAYNNTRENIAKIISKQIAFYTYCALKKFVVRERISKIILIGTGSLVYLQRYTSSSSSMWSF